MANATLTGSMRLVGCFLTGIVLYHFLGHGFSFAGEAVVFLLLLFLGLGWLALRKPLVRYRRWAGVAGMATVIAFSFCTSYLKNTPQTLPVAPQKITHYRLTLVKGVAVKPTSVSSVGRVDAVLAQGKWHAASGQVAVFFPRSAKTDTLRYGQELLVQGTLVPPKPPANPHQFDYRRYLALKHIAWQAYLPNSTWVPMGYAPPSRVVAVSLQVRKTLEQAFQEHITPRREKALAYALVLGVQDDLDTAIRNAYARTGTMHVLAVSGLHVALLYGVLLLFLKPFGRDKTSRLVVFLVTVGVVWFYAFMTGLSASVLRSVCMFSLVEVGRVLRRRASILNTLAVVALALLLYEPNFLFDVGFQLSFLAVAGIVLLQPLFLQIWHPEHRAIKAGWQLLSISVAAQLATLPLSLHYFHQFPVYFWVGNLVAVPLSSGALYLGIAFMLFFWVPGLNVVLGRLLEWTLWAMNEGLLWLEQWPASVLDGFVITPGQVLALYLLMICLVLFLVRRQLPWLAVAVLCLTFFSGTELAKAYHLRDSSELVLHSVRRSSATSVVQGRQVNFLADSAFYAQPQLFSYQVQPYWWAKGVRDEIRLRPDSSEVPQKLKVARQLLPEGNQLVVWQGKKLFWLKRLPKQAGQPLPLDAVVLQHNVWAPAERLQSFTTARTIVLDQTNSRWYTGKKATELRAAGYRVHVLEEQGAWRLVL
ncbi:ComEC/Rec2 family competence protein [Rufibacter glacialis]|uniref:ComEC family competence protein n=1 Tax=Rufibacter glacialis TaxID=1259555 RepID=A0A5M8QFB6_9BACT|nr:ComEC/Rec2 family competence protein [Rufibacter glacialis]KAA6434727.1 ComEC family competence protein [Rufibacter glacialis]GGK71953.1 competence protein [Rufibacter glacialis]